MTRRRWIADEVSGNHAAITGDHAEHLVRVLRARVGQEFDIAAGNVVRRGRIVTIQEGRVDFELGEEVCTAPAANITLLLAVFKFDRMEWAIEKCTELGVSRIVPVIAGRTHTWPPPQRNAPSAGAESRSRPPNNPAAPVRPRSLLRSSCKKWRA